MNAITVTRAERACFTAIVAGLCLTVADAARGQTESEKSIVESLRDGGHVLVMRHASSPRSAPDERTASPANVNRERELDETGQATATAMGYAFRALDITIGEVLSSPTFRALDTVRFLGYRDPEVSDELGPGRDQATWLLARASEQPAPGTNTLIVTHAPNIASAFGDEASDLVDGETLIVRPEDGRARIVGRMPIEEWAVLAVD
jgi:phosphohistidine phosphatase SixA